MKVKIVLKIKSVVNKFNNAPLHLLKKRFKQIIVKAHGESTN